MKSDTPITDSITSTIELRAFAQQCERELAKLTAIMAIIAEFRKELEDVDSSDLVTRD